MMNETGPNNTVFKPESKLWSWPLLTKIYSYWLKKSFVKQQLIRIKKLKFHEIASDCVGRKLIFRYLKMRRQEDPDTLLFFKCHLTCERLLRERDVVLNKFEIIAILYHLGPSVAWSKIIKNCFNKFEGIATREGIAPQGNIASQESIVPHNKIILYRESLYEIEISWEKYLRTKVFKSTNILKNILKDIYEEIYNYDEWNINTQQKLYRKKK